MTAFMFEVQLRARDAVHDMLIVEAVARLIGEKDGLDERQIEE